MIKTKNAWLVDLKPNNMTKQVKKLIEITNKCLHWANKNGHYNEIIIDNLINLEIAEQINSTKGQDKNFWIEVMDEHKKVRNEQIIQH